MRCASSCAPNASSIGRRLPTHQLDVMLMKQHRDGVAMVNTNATDDRETQLDMKRGPLSPNVDNGRSGWSPSARAGRDDIGCERRSIVTVRRCSVRRYNLDGSRPPIRPPQL